MNFIWMKVTQPQLAVERKRAAVPDGDAVQDQKLYEVDIEIVQARGDED